MSVGPSTSAFYSCSFRLFLTSFQILLLKTSWSAKKVSCPCHIPFKDNLFLEDHFFSFHLPWNNKRALYSYHSLTENGRLSVLSVTRPLVPVFFFRCMSLDIHFFASQLEKEPVTRTQHTLCAPNLFGSTHATPTSWVWWSWLLLHVMEGVMTRWNEPLLPQPLLLSNSPDSLTRHHRSWDSWGGKSSGRRFESGHCSFIVTDSWPPSALKLRFNFSPPIRVPVMTTQTTAGPFWCLTGLKPCLMLIFTMSFVVEYGACTGRQASTGPQKWWEMRNRFRAITRRRVIDCAVTNVSLPPSTSCNSVHYILSFLQIPFIKSTYSKPYAVIGNLFINHHVLFFVRSILQCYDPYQSSQGAFSCLCSCSWAFYFALWHSQFSECAELTLFKKSWWRCTFHLQSGVFRSITHSSPNALGYSQWQGLFHHRLSLLIVYFVSTFVLLILLIPSRKTFAQFWMDFGKVRASWFSNFWSSSWNSVKDGIPPP